jgi:phospho-N-acetylmuramoyl-pentapeptide-transferase
LSTIYGKRIIFFAKSTSVGETVRELGLAGQNEKQEPPTMEVLITATSVPVLFLQNFIIFILF